GGSGGRDGDEAEELCPGVGVVVVADPDERDAGGEGGRLVLVVVADADEDGELPGEADHDLGLVQPAGLPGRAEVEVLPAGQAVVGEELFGAAPGHLGPGGDVVDLDGTLEDGDDL